MSIYLFTLISLATLADSKTINFQEQAITDVPDYTTPSEHQVLFQKIGSYAATVQYLHVIIPINIDRTIQQLVRTSDELGRQDQANHQVDTQQLFKPEIVTGRIISKARTRIAKLVGQLYDIIDVLPDEHQLEKRQIGQILSTALGGVGTLMGLFNSNEIRDIARGVTQNKRKINSIIDIQQITNEHLNQLEISMEQVTSILRVMLLNNPSHLNSEIEDILSKGQNAVTRITNLVQQVQNRRMSVDLLTPTALKQLFKHLEEQADKQSLELLINKPSDLFQIEASYLHENKTLVIILHVPMVAEDNKLNLYQYIPFPLSQSLGANTTITPTVNKDLIAVGKQHQYKILGQTDLAACTKLGQNFLCEGRSVLRTDLENSCLGALFVHNLEGTLKHCQFELGETREHVFQTGPNEWLVSAPQPFSSVMQCEKEHDTIFVKTISTITVKPGCKLYLKSHVIQPDTGLRSTYEIKQHSWEWDIQHLFPTANLTLIAQALTTLRKNGNHIVNAKELQNLKFTEEEITSLMHPNYILIIVIILALGATAFMCYKLYRWYKFEHPQPLDEALAEFDRKERLEYLELKKASVAYNRELDVIKIGQRAPRNMNMAEYTVTQPTPGLYPKAPNESTMY